MGLCVPLVRSEASLKIQVNSPMRLGLKIRHGDTLTWPRYEPVLQIVRLAPLKGEAKKKTVCLFHAGAFMCCPWLSPPLFFSGNRPFTDWTFTDDFIMVLV